MTDEEKIRAVTAAMFPWDKTARTLARNEGWDIFESGGSYGPFELNKLDDPPPSVTPIQDDNDAWHLVAKSNKLHHIAAMDFLRMNSPTEYKHITHWVKHGNAKRCPCEACKR